MSPIHSWGNSSKNLNSILAQCELTSYSREYTRQNVKAISWRYKWVWNTLIFSVSIISDWCLYGSGLRTCFSVLKIPFLWYFHFLLFGNLIFGFVIDNLKSFSPLFSGLSFVTLILAKPASIYVNSSGTLKRLDKHQAFHYFQDWQVPSKSAKGRRKYFWHTLQFQPLRCHPCW